MSEITLTIDGKEIKAQKGDTVLEAAQRAGIRIPTLCAHEALEPYGACRLCIVQIDGIRGLPTSCTTPAGEGMVVNTASDEIIETRREIIKLLLSGHTSPCLVCYHREQCEKYRPRPFKSGKATRCTFCSNRDDCELRVLADEYDIEEFDLPIIYKDIELERSDPFMDRDYNLCVLCGRCARICKKIHGRGAIEFIQRGKDARIGTAFDRQHTESECKFCGACIDICPTGTLSDRFAKWYGSPDSEQESTCVLCPLGCSVNLKLKGGRIISSGMTAPTRDARICAAGRFVLPQLMQNPNRMLSHQLRIEDGLIRANYEEAVERAAEKLGAHRGGDAVVIAHESATREEIYILEKFASEVLGTDKFAVAREKDGDTVIEPQAVIDAVNKGEVKALYTTGDYIGAEALGGIETIVVADMFQSPAEKAAEVVIAAAALGETSGTFLNSAGEIRALVDAGTPPGDCVEDWKIACDLAKKMGASGFDFGSPGDIAKQMDGSAGTPPLAPDPSPLDDVAAIPKVYRGHRLDAIVCALQDIGIGSEAGTDAEEDYTPEDRPFRIVEKTEIVPNTHMTKVHAPAIAEKCLPGQFVIAMVRETSERIPYTISDFDRGEGTITLVTLEVGRSSREMANARAGEHLAHVAGPLGTPVEVKKYGTVVCAGGCYGVGAILPIARAMKEAGNRVICIEEASSHYLLHWQKELSAVCDELVIVTKDGSAGMKGGVQEAISMLDGRGEKIDQAYIIGCTFMMMLVCDVTKNLGIPTQTAMNPLMLDGTGMCGACRVTEGGATKFACVDGPFLDGLEIDWEELVKRQAAFKSEEIEALPQAGEKEHKHECTCSRA